MKLQCLYWKYGEGNSLNHVDEATGKIIIDKWNHPTEPEPTEAEIQIISDDYEQHLIDEKAQDVVNFAAVKAKLKNRLGISTKAEWKKFRKLIKLIAENLGD